MSDSERSARERPDLERVLGSLGAYAYEWDIASDRLRWSGEPELALGLAGAGDIASGRRYARFIDPTGPAGRHEAVMESAEADGGEGVAYAAHYRFLPPGGRADDARWLEDVGRWFAGADGRPARAEGVVRLVDERRTREARGHMEGRRDELTGALDRGPLLHALEEALRNADGDGACALAVVAVDNLSALNDAYGFDIGDQIIAAAASRIERELRRADSLGRLAGNKLGIVLNRCSEPDLRVAADRFVRAVGASPMATPLGAAGVSVSVGGVVLPRHARSAGDALAKAQEALMLARRQGAGSVAVFAPAPNRDAERRNTVRLAADIVAALNDGRIGLALQPIVAARDGTTVMHEALARLHGDSGSAGGAGFIETAERLGIVRLVDHRMLELAVAALDDDPDLALALNVSAGSATDGTWFASLVALARRRPGLAARLTVEITETMSIDDADRAAAFVRALHDLGCRVAIDDFGAGHTSFRSLRALGADIVKIDGGFAENVADSPDNAVFVEALVRLAGQMGMETVAERVVTEADAATLRALGVDYLQGHLYGAARHHAPAAHREARPA